MGFFMPTVNRAEILITYIIYILNEQNKEYMHKHSPLNCLAKVQNTCAAERNIRFFPLQIACSSSAFQDFRR
jgi:hypothetical protein